MTNITEVIDRGTTEANSPSDRVFVHSRPKRPMSLMEGAGAVGAYFHLDDDGFTPEMDAALEASRAGTVEIRNWRDPLNDLD